MKEHRRILRSLLVALGMALALVPALAADRRELKVSQPTFLQGTEIPAGDYSLRWVANGEPDEVSLTVQAGKKVLATAVGRRIQLDKPSIYDSLIYANGDAGSRSLVEIRFAGKTDAVRIEPRVESSLR